MDPERRARRKQATPYRASYRVAAWSRIDLPALSTALALWAVLFVPFGFMGERRISLSEFALTLAVVMLPVVMYVLRFADLVRVDERGVYAVRGRGGKAPPTVRLSLQKIAGFEVRDWSRSLEAANDPAAKRGWIRTLRPRRTICARLHDGSYVELFARSRGWQHPVLLVKQGRSPFWKPARGPDGRWLVWTSRTDQAVADLLKHDAERMRAALGIPPTAPRRKPGPPMRSYGFRVDVYRRVPPTRLGERGWYSTSLTGTDPPIQEPAPEPLPPRPPELPEAPASGPRAADETPAVAAPSNDDLVLPTRYWTLASLRSGSILGRRSSMVVDRDGVTFDRRWSRDLHVPLADADRFDIDFDSVGVSDPESGRLLEGNWRLYLVCRDGTHVPLSGLDHGYFKQNRLFWATGKAAERVGEATGSMPWPNEQPLLVAARLNAHLEAARKAAGLPTHQPLATASR